MPVGVWGSVLKGEVMQGTFLKLIQGLGFKLLPIENSVYYTGS